MRRSGKPEDHKTDEEYEQMLPGFNNFWEQNYVPYIESLGNCEIVTIPTGHMTYEYKPDEVGEVLVQLVEKVEAAKKIILITTKSNPYFRDCFFSTQNT